MKVLGIDTSTSCGSVGLIEDEETVSEYLLNIPVTHSERLLGAIDVVLREARRRIEEVEGWVIALGPGSFTGLRIGISTVKGLAFATGKPVAGVSTLDVLASQIAPTSYLICPILDARKKEVYAGFYRYRGEASPTRQSEYQAISPESLVSQIKEQTIFIGDGVRTYGDFLRNRLGSLAILPSSPFHVSHGSMTARLGMNLLKKGEHLNLSAFSPLYIRPSEAEIKWGETHSSQL